MPGGGDGTRCICSRRAVTTDFLGCRFPDHLPTTRQRMRRPTTWRATPAISTSPSEPGSKSTDCRGQAIDSRWFVRAARLLADNVIVATGAYNNPRIPPFAAELDTSIVQLHSKDYRNPSQLREGGVLMVGAGNSGAEIAIEIAPHHQTWLSGRDTGQEPTRAGSRMDLLLTPVLWFMATRFTVNTPPGRKMRDHFLDPPRGIPLGRVRRKDIVAAGIERVGRTTGVKDGYPMLEDGRVLDVSNVIWSTGYTPNYDWIDFPLPTHNGVPVHIRGIVESCPGLYLMGLLFLYSLSSALVGGVGRDAEYIVDHIAANRTGSNQEVSGLAAPS